MSPPKDTGKKTAEGNPSITLRSAARQDAVAEYYMPDSLENVNASMQAMHTSMSNEPVTIAELLKRKIEAAEKREKEKRDRNQALVDAILTIGQRGQPPLAVVAPPTHENQANIIAPIEIIVDNGEKVEEGELRQERYVSSPACNANGNGHANDNGHANGNGLGGQDLP